MKRLLLFALVAAISTNVYSQTINKDGEIICQAINQDQFVKIMPPDKFFLYKNSRTQASATIDVRYNGFSDEAKNAFQHAVDIWASLLQSDVTITIIANWQSLSNGVLGTASPGETFKNFEGAPIPDVEYPAALAEKLARKTLNSSGAADITANFSKEVNWYFGIDGNTPAGKFDLVTVVLHELGHGLGFTGSFSTNQAVTTARWGTFEGSARIYDYFLVNNLKQQLIDESLFTNNSSEMLSLVGSNNLFFNSLIAQPFNGNQNPRLFSPSPYNPGSSVSHLDEADFASGNAHSLMTPFIGSAEAIHNPGEIVLSIFAEMGWVYTFLDHQPLKDTEDTTSPLMFSLMVDSDNGVIENSVKLIYSLDGFNTTNEGIMQPIGNTGEYRIEINNPGAATVSYYFSLFDVDNRNFVSHGNPAEASFNFAIGIDEQAPIITHTPIVEYFDGDPNPILIATVADNLGVDTVFVEYAVNQVDQEPVALNFSGNNQYQTTLKLLEKAVNPGDEITYRVKAIDLANQPNESSSPNAGFHSFAVFGVVQSYQNDFDNNSNDFIGDFYNIDTPAGFSTGAIHSQHPYASPVVGTDTSYTFQLKFIIKILNEGAYLKYDDIALVEPGVAGSIFGISAFRDYVVVEGSNDLGNTWLALADGYDATFKESWQTLYESNVVDNVSQSVPDQQLFENHEINLAETFAIGDDISIRFRLFANQSASGWGWTLDNLEINGEGNITGLPDKNNQSPLVISPNPASDRLILHPLATSIQQDLQVSILDLAGKLYLSNTLNANQINTIDISGLEAGLYLVLAESATQLYTEKLLIQR